MNGAVSSQAKPNMIPWSPAPISSPSTTIWAISVDWLWMRLVISTPSEGNSGSPGPYPTSARACRVIASTAAPSRGWEVSPDSTTRCPVTSTSHATRGRGKPG